MQEILGGIAGVESWNGEVVVLFEKDDGVLVRILICGRGVGGGGEGDVGRSG